MTTTPINVIGTYEDLDGSALSGTVTFVLSAWLQNDVIKPGVPLVVPLDVNGQISVSLPATDDVGVMPTGITYTVTETVVGADGRNRSRSYPLAVSHTTPGGTLDLRTVAPAAASTPLFPVALLTDLAAETTRATSAETTLTAGLAAEASRAEAAEALAIHVGETTIDVSTYSNDIQAAHDALPTGGGRLVANKKVYTPAAGLHFTKRVNLEGAGRGASPADAMTVITVPAGQTMILLDTGAGFSRLAHFYLKSLSVALGTDDGIAFRAAGRTIVENVTVDGVGRDAFSVDSTGGGNNNRINFRDAKAVGAHRRGFYLAGPNSNEVTIGEGCESVGHVEYGYYVEHAVAKAVLLQPHADSSGGVGDYYDNATSCFYLEPYSEGAKNFVIDTQSIYGTLLVGNYALPTLVVNGNGILSWVIKKNGNFVGRLAIDGVPADGSPHTFTFFSGAFGSGVWSLVDTTVAKTLMTATGGGAVPQIAMKVPLSVTQTLSPRASQTLGADGAVTIDASLGDAVITLSANATSSTITNPITNQILRVTVIEDATGGWTFVWPTNTKWATGAPTIPPVSGRTTVTLRYDGTNWVELARSDALTKAVASGSIADVHTDGVAVNTTAETVIATLAVPTTLAAGDILRVRLAGDMLNNSAGSVTFVLKVKLGTTTLHTNSTLTLTASAALHQWSINETILIVNPASDQRSSADLAINAASASAWPLALAAGNGFVTGRGVAAANLTSATNLTVTATMGTADPNANVTCHEAMLWVEKR